MDSTELVGIAASLIVMLKIASITVACKGYFIITVKQAILHPDLPL